MSSNSANKQSVFFDELVRMPSPKSRRANVVLKVLEHEAKLVQAAKERAESRPVSVPLSDNRGIDFASFRPSPVHFTVRPTPTHFVDAADNGLPPDEPPAGAAKPPRKVVSRKAKFWRALQRRANLAKRAKWAVQYPKSVKPTSNGGHLVLSNHTNREGEKLINAINRDNRPRKKHP
jgi:hypothetical protein